MVRPGDTLVVTTRHSISPEQMGQVKARIMELMPGVGASVIVASDVDLMVYRPETTENQ